ncbi:MAG: cytochrome c [Lentisphaeraceae bacterium]|nr:cytochrome c [Lentisphaeraceae bacterium]
MAKDMQGAQMAMMAKSLIRSDADLDAVVAYVGSLAKVKVPHSLKGNAAKGQAAYATCMACHGPTAAGNPAMKAPSLLRLPDLYIVAHLKKFKSGIRGADAVKDPQGAMMATMAKMIANEEAMKDIAEYIKTLSK